MRIDVNALHNKHNSKQRIIIIKRRTQPSLKIEEPLAAEEAVGGHCPYIGPG